MGKFCFLYKIPFLQVWNRRDNNIHSIALLLEISEGIYVQHLAQILTNGKHYYDRYYSLWVKLVTISIKEVNFCFSRFSKNCYQGFCLKISFRYFNLFHNLFQIIFRPLHMDTRKKQCIPNVIKLNQKLFNFFLFELNLSGMYRKYWNWMANSIHYV